MVRMRVWLPRGRETSKPNGCGEIMRGAGRVVEKATDARRAPDERSYLRAQHWLEETSAWIDLRDSLSGDYVVLDSYGRILGVAPGLAVALFAITLNSAHQRRNRRHRVTCQLYRRSSLENV